MKEKKIKPPQWADHFLEWYCHPGLLEEIQGDLHEHFSKQCKERGPGIARFYFALNVILFLRLSTIRNLTPSISTIMWQNYIKIAIRNLAKHWSFSLINIMGLTVGLASAFFIFLWIQDETSFDRFHDNGSNIYRVYRNMNLDAGKIISTSTLPYLMAEELRTSYPEVENVEMISWEEELIFTNGENSFRQKGRFTSKSFFETFTYPFLEGDPGTSLKDVNGIVISESLAAKYFGSDWEEKGSVIGKSVKVLQGQQGAANFTITGVFQDMPTHSSYQFDFALSLDIFVSLNSWVESWTNNGLRMYLSLKEGTDLAAFREKIKPIIREHAPEEPVDVLLQPYEEMYLYNKFLDGQQAGGRIDYVQIFFIVAIFLLLVACINFMNLATARSSVRVREIGVRKTIGANKNNLVSQFIWESIFFAFISLLLALILVWAFLPYFNELTNKEIIIDWLNPTYIGGALGIAIMVGVLAGSYPAFFLSSLNIIQILKGIFKPGNNTISLRKGLVVFQFVIANILIIGTLTLNRQIQFIKNKNLGYNKENVIYMPLEGENYSKFDVFKQQLAQHPSIVSVTSATSVPTSIYRSSSGASWDGKDPNANIEITVLSTGFDYSETMGLEFLEGRSHSDEYATDSLALIVNEAAVKIMEMKSPVGQQVKMWGDDYKIIGVAKNFHFRSLHETIEPIFIRLADDNCPLALIRLDGEKTENALNYIEKVNSEINPDFPFSYEFLDEAYADTFNTDTIVGRLSQFFSFISILISCLGLLGLSTFAAERKSKEISIRKVLGASVSQLLVLLSRDFVSLVIIAFVISLPITWYLMDIWLENFAYKISLGIKLFAIGGILSLLIAIFTISFQSIKVAISNPVKALKSE